MTDAIHSFFGLTQPAFGPITEPGQIFRSGLMQPVVKELLAGAHVLAIRGGAGAGKTAFMHVLAMELQARQLPVAVIDEASASSADILARIGQAGGLNGGAPDPENLLRALWDQASIRRLIVLCDNAETLSADAFRTLSLLVQLRLTQPLRLQLVLLGEFGDWQGLAGPDLEDLRQASTSRYITFSLRNSEAAAYLDHRLRYAGQPLQRVMTPSAVAALRDQAHGNPRRLDELAEQALLYGYRTKRRRLTASSVRQALTAKPGAINRRAPIVLASALAAIPLAAAVWFYTGGTKPTSPPIVTVAQKPTAPKIVPSPPPPPRSTAG